MPSEPGEPENSIMTEVSALTGGIRGILHRLGGPAAVGEWSTQAAQEIAEYVTRPTPTSEQTELVEHWKKECNRYTNGKCMTRACLVRGGWASGPPDYSVATCEVHETIEALSSLPTSRDEWQPIETAPKDGTPILLGYFRENLDGSIYQEGGAPVVAAWVPTKKLADDGAEINWVACGKRLRSSRSFSPTHWRPLPAPPGQEPRPPSNTLTIAGEALREAREAFARIAATVEVVGSETDDGEVGVKTELCEWEMVNVASRALATIDKALLAVEGG